VACARWRRHPSAASTGDPALDHLLDPLVCELALVGVLGHGGESLERRERLRVAIAEGGAAPLVRGVEEAAGLVEAREVPGAVPWACQRAATSSEPATSRNGSPLGVWSWSRDIRMRRAALPATTSGRSHLHPSASACITAEAMPMYD
jgi:hypothetical protein